MSASDLTDAEREALKNPLIAKGARLEGEYRDRCLGKHREFMQYMQALVDTRPDADTRVLALSGVRVFSSKRERLRFAWKLARR